MSRTRFLVWLNAALLAMILAVLAVQLTGIPVHEWLGLAVSGVIVTHVVSQWDWLRGALRRAPGAGQGRLRVNLGLHALLFGAMVVAIYSGLMISMVVVPAVGLPVHATSAWSRVHSLSRYALTVLVGLHLAINWRWIANVVLRLFTARPVGSGREKAVTKDLASPGTAVDL